MKKVYGTSEALGIAFPTTSSGFLGAIFEEMRKESLVVLEDCIFRISLSLFAFRVSLFCCEMYLTATKDISKNLSPNPRFPTKTPSKGGSVGSNVPNSSAKQKFARSKSRSFSK